jgi:hypothetical protein
MNNLVTYIPFKFQASHPPLKFGGKGNEKPSVKEAIRDIFSRSNRASSSSQKKGEQVSSTQAGAEANPHIASSEQLQEIQSVLNNPEIFPIRSTASQENTWVPSPKKHSTTTLFQMGTNDRNGFGHAIEECGTPKKAQKKLLEHYKMQARLQSETEKKNNQIALRADQQSFIAEHTYTIITVCRMSPDSSKLLYRVSLKSRLPSVHQAYPSATSEPSGFSSSSASKPSFSPGQPVEDPDAMRRATQLEYFAKKQAEIDARKKAEFEENLAKMKAAFLEQKSAVNKS